MFKWANNFKIIILNGKKCSGTAFVSLILHTCSYMKLLLFQSGCLSTGLPSHVWLKYHWLWCETTNPIQSKINCNSLSTPSRPQKKEKKKKNVRKLMPKYVFMLERDIKFVIPLVASSLAKVPTRFSSLPGNLGLRRCLVVVCLSQQRPNICNLYCIFVTFVPVER